MNEILEPSLGPDEGRPGDVAWLALYSSVRVRANLTLSRLRTSRKRSARHCKPGEVVSHPFVGVQGRLADGRSPLDRDLRRTLGPKTTAHRLHAGVKDE